MEVFKEILRYANIYSITLFVYAFLVCLKQEKRKLFFVRLIPVIAVCVFLSSDIFRNFFDMGRTTIQAYIKTLPYVIVWLVAVLSVWFCFKISVLQAFLFQSIAYVFEHIIFNIRQGLSIDNIENKYILYIVLILMRVALGVCIYFTVAQKTNRLYQLFNYKVIVALLASVNIFFVLFANNIFFNQGWFTNALHIMRLVICAVLIALPFVINRMMQDKDEKQKLEYMLTISNKQMRNADENIESINRKCHNLKHQLIMLKETGQGVEFQQVISSLERDILIYDSNINTGNKSIDIIIKEKSLLCDSHNIDFTYIIDGDKLSFMHKADLYSLFGNALDNAIEAAKQSELDKRVIILRVSGKDGICKILIENSYVTAPEIIDGLPQTTKADKANHGFGVKSIKMIVEKYNGEIDFAIENDRFSLMILFFDDKMGNK